jgi:hypothetical protein
MGTATEPKGAATAGEYLRWKKDVAQHDYTAASSYLSIRFGETHAEKVAAELRKLPVITRRANDILRATGRIPLPLSDPGVLKDLKKVLAGQKLSPILVAESDIADGYHRLSLAYALDPYATVPLKLGGVSLLRPLRVRRLPADQLAVRVAGVVAARGGRHHVGGAVRHQIEGDMPVVAGAPVNAVGRVLAAGERHVRREPSVAGVLDAGQHLV